MRISATPSTGPQVAAFPVLARIATERAAAEHSRRISDAAAVASRPVPPTPAAAVARGYEAGRPAALTFVPHPTAYGYAAAGHLSVLM